MKLPGFFSGIKIGSGYGTIRGAAYKITGGGAGGFIEIPISDQAGGDILRFGCVGQGSA